MEYKILNNGIRMPMLGYGLYKVPPEEAEACVGEALRAGYRSIDTAQYYRNEQAAGAAIRKSGIPRDELFITTKVWISNSGYERARASIEESLRRLGTDYADLILIHQPFGDYYGTWQALEEAVEEGKTRAIGLSNFQAARFMDLAANCRIAPAIDQLECNVYSQQEGILPYLAPYGTSLEAWGPLGQGRNGQMDDPILCDIARSHGRTAAQAALRFLIQKGIVAIPKSTNPARIRENFDVFSFELSPDEMSALNALNRNDTGTRCYEDPAYAARLINDKA